MKHWDLPYYVCLLSAAQYYGASHQKPQVFQVMIHKQIKSLVCGKVKIDFIYKKSLDELLTQKISVKTGYLTISTPELTAWDLLRYSHHVGGLNHIATVLSELIERINPETLALLVTQSKEKAWGQRLGYILEHIDSMDEKKQKDIIECLYQSLVKPTNPVPLAPELPVKGESRDLRWMIIENTTQRSLVFRGGTALNKLYINPPARYSEDIDLVQINPEPIGNTLDAIRDVLDSWLGEPQRKLTERSAKLVYRYTAIDNTPARLKIEINTTEHFNVKPIIAPFYSVDSEWFQGETHIMTYHLDELMGTKLRALYQRRKGRDLFDLWYVLDKKLANAENIISIFERYCQHNADVITRAMFEKNLFLKKKHNDFLADMGPLLTQEVNWDFEKAILLVERDVFSNENVPSISNLNMSLFV